MELTLAMGINLITTFVGTLLMTIILGLFILAFACIFIMLCYNVIICMGLFRSDLDDDFDYDMRNAFREKHFAKDKIDTIKYNE